MKTRSPELAAHQALPTTTLARCWQLTRRDGLVLAVNDSDVDLTIGGVTYSAANGVLPSAISSDATNAVVNMEINSFLRVDGITEEDVLAGFWDGASIIVFEVNRADLSQGQMRLITGNVGELKVSRNSFNSEVRGISQSLQGKTGRVVTKGCPWIFGEPNTCRYPIETVEVSGALTAVTDRMRFADSGRAEPDDYFGGGLITFQGSGPNANVSMEVAEYDGAGNFLLALPMPFNLEVGDSYTLLPGCRKRFAEDCNAKWDNINNFGGFPLLPGADKILGIGGTEGTNL